MTTKMLNPNPNMLLRIAQADAFCCAVEYIDRQKHEALFEEALKFEKYLPSPERPGWNAVKPACYSDDTQMSIAVARALCIGGGPNIIDFAGLFIAHYGWDKRGGYSSRIQGLLDSVQKVPYAEYEMLRASVMPSDSNGAAMRAVPIGVLPDPEQVTHVAAKQALITHDTPGGVESAKVVALCSHFALYRQKSPAFYDEFFGLHRFLDEHLAPKTVDFVSKMHTGRVAVGRDPSGKQLGGMGMLTARAVVTLLTTRHSLMSILKQVIEWGGDTDSVASIAWGIASCRYQTEKIPEFFERDLEPGGKFGVDYLKEIGVRLMERYA